MKTDLFLLLVWWFYLFALGLLFMPVTQYFTNRFFDKGYLFSRLIAILAVAYTVWFLSSIKLFPFSRLTILMILPIFFYFIFIKFRGITVFKELVQNNKKIFIIEELIFLIVLAAWAFVRAMQPNIFGIEKFADFGFINSILRTEYMPPLDIWFAGEPLNYYYFGQYITAFLIKLTNISPTVCFNLMLATIYALTFCFAFSIAGNIVYLAGKKRWTNITFAGTISAILLCWGGNLHTLIFAYILPFAQKMGWYVSTLPITYYYADSTRFIGHNPPTHDKTITEFPAYSFVISDLHAHFINLPVTLLFVAVLLYMTITPPAEKQARILSFMSKPMLFIAFLLAINLMTNTWDYPIYLMITAGVMFYRNFSTWGLNLRSAGATLAYGMQIIAVSILFAIPFILRFHNFSKGIDFVHANTTPYQLLILWGHQLFFVICFVLFLAILGKRYFSSSLEKGFWKKLYRFFITLPASHVFAFILVCSAIILVVIPEIIYVKDIYYIEAHRANTMFKLTFQAFILFCIAIGYIVVVTGSMLYSLNRSAFWVFSFLSAIMLVSPLLFLPFAIRAYYGPVQPEFYKGLDGIHFFKYNMPDDYQALLWLNKNINNQPVVLEADGGSFSQFNRFSAFTGFPTLLGWFGHENLYRDTSAIPAARSAEVTTVYESQDWEETQDILIKYDVRYIILGSLERERFKNINEAKLFALGDIVFENQTVKIFAIHPERRIANLKNTPCPTK